MSNNVHIIAPKGEHKQTIILLHGRDSNATDFASELFESQASNNLTLPEIFSTVKWVFPYSGAIRSERFGAELNQWFDMWSTENPHERSDEQWQATGNASEKVGAVVREAAEVVGAGIVLLGGISQGGAVAVDALLGLGGRIGGFVGLSSWRVETGKEGAMKGTVRETPVFLGHCADDEVIKLQYGEELRGGLEGLGFGVECKRYAAGGHWVNEPDGIGA